MRRFFRNPMNLLGVLLAGGLILLSLAAPLLPLAPPDETHLDQRLLPILSENHPLGTDALGRDLLSRVLHGLRVSLGVALAATLLAASFGSIIGMVAGYYGRWLETILMRSMDVALAFPYLILALAIVAVLGPGLINALLAISIVNIPFFARATRSVTLGLKNQSFVESATMSGQGGLSILLREIFPNVLPTVIIAGSTTLGWMILETAGLSFLGLGAQPPQADLGSMLAESRTLLLVAPHTGIVPGVVIFLLILGINLTGDGIRDLLDPNLRGSGSVRPQPATLVTASSPSPEAGTTVDHHGLSIRALTVAFRGTDGALSPGVDSVSLSVPPGECLGVVGESGSGKTVTAMSILRLLASPPAEIRAGEIRFAGQDLIRLDGEALRAVRGNRVSVIFQDPLSSLNPLETIGFQLTEAILVHHPTPSPEARSQALELVRKVGLPDPEWKFRQYPHQLSGGQRQRVGIAMALANDPDLIIADEPTTALDVTVQKKVLGLLNEVRRERNASMLFISHDLAVVSHLADRIAVMKDGAVVETGVSREILRRPRNSYTRDLLKATPDLSAVSREDTTILPQREDQARSPLLRVEGLVREFSIGQRFFGRHRRLRAVDGVDLTVHPSDCLGVVGESGSGKSTLLRILAGLTDPTAGRITFKEDSVADWLKHRQKDFHRQVQFVFQDPRSAFNPRRSIGDALDTPLHCLLGYKKAKRRKLIRETLELCQLQSTVVNRFPHEFSGGQAQRIAIARAIITRPSLLLLDEPVSALDVSVQKRILELLRKLREELDLTVIMVSHDLAVVSEICPTLVVMKDGRIVEQGLTRDILTNPREPYTRELLDSVFTLSGDPS